MKIKPRSDWMDFNGCALDVMFQNYCNPSKIWKNRKSLIWNRFSGWCGCLSNTKNLNWTGRVNFARSNHALPVRWPSFCPWQPWDDPTSFLESCHGRGWIWGEEVDLETRPNINVCTFVWFLYMRLYIYIVLIVHVKRKRESNQLTTTKKVLITTTKGLPNKNGMPLSSTSQRVDFLPPKSNPWLRIIWGYQFGTTNLRGAKENKS